MTCDERAREYLATLDEGSELTGAHDGQATESFCIRDANGQALFTFVSRTSPGRRMAIAPTDPRRGAADRGQYRKAAYFATLRVSRDKRSGAVMTRPRIHFNCPHCNALYQIVRTETGPETTTEREVTCRACAGPLPAREGNFILKYFLLRKAPRLGPRARRGSQRAAPSRRDG